MKVDYLIATQDISKKEAKQIHKILSKKFKAIGINLSLGQVITIGSPDVIRDLEYPYRFPKAVADKILKAYPLNPKRLTHILCEPIIDKGRRNFGGMTMKVCMPEGSLWSVSTAYRDKTRTMTRSDLYPCACIAAHEIGHALGMQHGGGVLSLMKDTLNFIYKYPQSLKFEKIHAEQVRLCGHVEVKKGLLDRIKTFFL